MPQAIAFAALIVSSYATTVAAANLLYLGTLAVAYGGLAYASYAISAALAPKPSVPKPEDGTYNLKQPVPSLPIVLGTVKKASDYLFLEERNGIAMEILCWAGHRIDGYETHYLHDEAATLDVDGWVTVPDRYNGNQTVRLLSRIGLSIETAYDDIVTLFPEIWTADHRGDGLSTIRASYRTVDQEDTMSIYPNQKPEHSAVGRGMRILDPRDDTVKFTQLAPLLRLWHLCSPYGGKMSLADMYLPEWIDAINTADEDILDKNGDTLKRYNAGMWFRANSDQVAVGRLLDQASEIVVYERLDGLVGVHSGKFVPPTVTIKASAMISFSLDGNTRVAGTVLAVRGRFTDPTDKYNTRDAALVGDPYVLEEDTERTFTVDNVAIQNHNHMQRIQTITKIRKNAPRASVTAHYEAAKPALGKRWIYVEDETIPEGYCLEITTTPRVDITNLRISLSGIIVPETLYDFDPLTQEGDPGPVVVELTGTGVPMPLNFEVFILTEVLTGGNSACYALATWDFVGASLTYELEWQETGGSPPHPVQSTLSKKGEDEVRSTHLADVTEFRFRLRTWSNGGKSDWTSYETLSTEADTIAPAAISFNITGSLYKLGGLAMDFVTSNDSHLKGIKLYQAPKGVTLNKTTHYLTTIAAAPGTTFSYAHGDTTRVNLASNSALTTSTGLTLGAGWTTGAGGASGTAGSNSVLSQAVAIANAAKARIKFEISVRSAGNVRARIATGASPSNDAPDRGAVGVFLETITATGARDTFALRKDSAFVGTVKDVIIYEETLGCLAQGDFDFYAIPINGSGKEGPQSGPINKVIV